MASMGDLTNATRKQLLTEIEALRKRVSRLSPIGTQQYQIQTKGQKLDNLQPHKRIQIPSVKSDSKPFRFSDYAARPIAIKVAYCGWDYFGLTCQDGDTVETVEYHLYRALLLNNLIPSHRECRWNRSGRTDKGVSAFGQVVNLFIRSSLPLGTKGTVNWPLDEQECMDCKECDEHIDEYPYITMINQSLPDDIRIISWAPVDGKFDSRFSCTFREYKYYFPTSGLDILKMTEAAKLFEGDHDFRNFCKIDMQRIDRPFGRTINSSLVYPLSDDSKIHADFDASAFHVFCINGRGFLWHQVRMIMAVLLAIGRGDETSNLITELLDIQKNPAKPSFEMANELPLVLADCGYQNHTLKWQQDLKKNFSKSFNVQVMINNWKKVATKQTICAGMIGAHFKNEGLRFNYRGSSAKYVPILRLSRNNDPELIRDRVRVKNGLKFARNQAKKRALIEEAVMMEELIHGKGLKNALVDAEGLNGLKISEDEWKEEE